MSMRLTQDNAHEYEGKLLDANPRMFHYYPLEVRKNPSGVYCVKDATGTNMTIPERYDLFNRIDFDFILMEGEG